ncbi:unnamed protein product, partial [Sphacelaria rigidula]
GLWLNVKWLAAASAVLDINIAVWEPRGDKAAVKVYNSVESSKDGMYYLNEADAWVHLLYCSAADGNRARETSPDSPPELSRHNHFNVLFLNRSAREGVAKIVRDVVERDELPLPHLKPYEHR